MVETICIIIWWILALIVFGCIGYASSFHDPFQDQPMF